MGSFASNYDLIWQNITYLAKDLDQVLASCRVSSYSLQRIFTEIEYVKKFNEEWTAGWTTVN